MDEDMAKVLVRRAVTICPDPTVTIHYPAGYEGVAPRAHIEQIVASGAGEHVNPNAAPQQQPTAGLLKTIIG